MIDLSGKSVIVLGGVGGIGKAIVSNLLDYGLKHLGVIDIVDERTAHAALKDFILPEKKIQFVYAKSLVEDEDALRKTMQGLATKLKGVDVVINSVGVLDELDPKKTILINYVS